jgi:hypothetical protein
MYFVQVWITISQRKLHVQYYISIAGSWEYFFPIAAHVKFAIHKVQTPSSLFVQVWFLIFKWGVMSFSYWYIRLEVQRAEPVSLTCHNTRGSVWNCDSDLYKVHVIAPDLCSPREQFLKISFGKNQMRKCNCMIHHLNTPTAQIKTMGSKILHVLQWKKKVFSSIGNGNAMVFDMKLLCEIVIQTCTK